MDVTERKLTKIAREVQRFAGKVLRDSGIGLSEYEFIHLVRHNPGISQQGVGDKLGLDKAAVARRAANLERKGLLERKPDPTDGRGKRLFPTAQAELIKDSKNVVESFFYEWLLEDIKGEELDNFLMVLDQIYWKSKNERRAEFKNLLELEGNNHVRFEP